MSWSDKHPCSICGTGYGRCIQGLRHNLMCCKGCYHPSRFKDKEPWTADDLREMWEGTEMPTHVLHKIEQLESREKHGS